MKVVLNKINTFKDYLTKLYTSFRATLLKGNAHHGLINRLHYFD